MSNEPRNCSAQKVGASSHDQSLVLVYDAVLAEKALAIVVDRVPRLPGGCRLCLTVLLTKSKCREGAVH